MVGNALRAEEVVHWATMGGARALGLADRIGSVTAGKKADLVLIKNPASPALYPILHPYGTVVYQAGRGDVHTVLVNGQVVKHEGRLLGGELAAARSEVENTVDHVRSAMGEQAWSESMTPELPDVQRIPNPYTYTAYDGELGRAQES